MLIWFDENGKITATNKFLTKAEGQDYIGYDCTWVENPSFPSVPEEFGKAVIYYIDEKGNITAGYEDLPQEPMERLTDEQQAILETAVNVDYLVCLADLGL